MAGSETRPSRDSRPISPDLSHRRVVAISGSLYYSPLAVLAPISPSPPPRSSPHSQTWPLRGEFEPYASAVVLPPHQNLDVMATATFLELPVEVRLVIYDVYLMMHQRVEQRRQPINSHLKLLRTCRQIYDEAHPIFWQYISLRDELEINAFILNTSDAAAARVLWADVANDTRVFVHLEQKTEEVVTLPHVSMQNSSMHRERAPLPCRTSISHSAGCLRCNGCVCFNAAVEYLPIYKVCTTRSMSATPLLRSRC